MDSSFVQGLNALRQSVYFETERTCPRLDIVVDLVTDTILAWHYSVYVAYLFAYREYS